MDRRQNVEVFMRRDTNYTVAKRSAVEDDCPFNIKKGYNER